METFPTLLALCFWIPNLIYSLKLTHLDTLNDVGLDYEAMVFTAWKPIPNLYYTDWVQRKCIMTSSNGNISRFTGPLCGEFTGHRWNSPHKGQWCGALAFSLICAWTNDWVNNRETGDLRRHRAHYDVTIMEHCIVRYQRRTLTAVEEIDNDTTLVQVKA